MGTILNEGLRLPERRFENLDFARGSPYETRLQPTQPFGRRVMDASVARLLRHVLAEVVEEGTARRLAGVFAETAGGKTGSGDNRSETFGPGGALQSSRVVSRTGSFVFFVGDRFFGVLTAHVGGEQARNYSFTSALPVAVLKLLAPDIEAAEHWAGQPRVRE
jgi:membrane peptidoglycan carboxypeptidase